ncbi:MAG: hypothetical protein ACKUBY_05840 [Candidatus Moraniibacteriota bacterium]
MFQIHKKLFFGIIAIFLIIGSIFYFTQTQTYKTILTLNITRDVSVKVKEYSYDDFYRLQADERFADTVVRWIQAPHIIVNVFDEIDTNSMLFNKKKFDAKRLSSQVVNVEFVTFSKKDAKNVSKKLVILLNEESQKLNQKQDQENWFVILGSEPITENANKSLIFIFGVSLFLGFFVAFWAVMIRHYMIDDK